MRDGGAPETRTSMALEVIEIHHSRAVLRFSSDQLRILFSLVFHATGQMLHIEDLAERTGVSTSETSELASELLSIIHRVSKEPVDEIRKDVRHIGLYGTEDDHATIEVTVDQVALFRGVAECTFGRLEEWRDTLTILGFCPEEDELAFLGNRMSDTKDQS